MDIVKIAIIGIIAVILILTIKKDRPEFGIIISIVAGIIIITFILGKLAAVIKLLEMYSNKAGISNQYLIILLKITGIAYISEFAAQICRDAGESSIGSKVEIASKIIIVVVGIPIITAVLDLIISLIK